VDTPPTPPAAQPPAPASPSPPPSRRLRKRFLFPLILLGLVGAALLWAYVRGTWADTVPHDPKSSAEGVVCQLYRTPEGHTPVRCAAVIDRSLGEVWKVVTDYDHYGDIFPTLRSAPVVVVRDDAGHYHLSGVASSVLGDWPFDIRIRHEESPEKKSASWDNAAGDVRLNRGSFVLTPLGADRTLLVYSLEVEIASYPNFLVRNVLLSRQPGVMKGLIERLKG